MIDEPQIVSYVSALEKLGIDLLGREFGNVKTICPKCRPTSAHPESTCLSVNIDLGRYKCWDNGGDGCGFQGSIGLKPRYEREKHREGRRDFSRPDENKYTASLREMPQEAILYMEGRGISRATLDRCEVGWGYGWKDVKTGVGMDVYRFPYRNAGVLVNVKSRPIKKDFRLYPQAELIPWRIDHRQKTTYYVEGEIDALSLVEIGIDNVVSIPNGGNTSSRQSLEYLDAVWSEISEISHHVMVLDDDDTGHGTRDEMVRRFGERSCSYVDYRLVCITDHDVPLDDKGRQRCKDANEILMHHGADALRTLIDRAVPFKLNTIVRPMDLLDTILSWKRDGVPTGLSTGFDDLDDLWRVMPGELTIITGAPGTGKSEAADALALNLARLHDWRVAMFSPEYYPPARHMIKLIEKRIGKVFDGDKIAYWRRQRLRCEEMTEEDVQEHLPWIGEHFSYIDRDDTGMTVDRVLEEAQFEVYRRGIKLLILDPWNELDHLMDKGLTETLYVSKALSKIKLFAQKNQVHVFLVAHPTKLPHTMENYTVVDADGNEAKRSRMVYPVPTLYSISGGANFKNKADNGLVLWRDVHAEAHGTNPHLLEFHLDKVRWKSTGRTGMASLAWDPPTGRFRSASAEEIDGAPHGARMSTDGDDDSLEF